MDDFVDDEEMILEVGQALLEKLGYRVIVAVGGKQAVETLYSEGDTIDMVILDLIMLGMDGSRTFDMIVNSPDSILVRPAMKSCFVPRICLP